jgi:hypothetical protein
MIETQPNCILPAWMTANALLSEALSSHPQQRSGPGVKQQTASMGVADN